MKQFLEYASQKYYEGNPVITDEEFDALATKYNFDLVGHTVDKGISHLYPMYSLQKCFSLAEAPLPIDKCVNTPKLDGAAVSLLYINGSLTLALTRGNGKKGLNITEKMAYLVPGDLGLSGVIQITGEVVAPLTVPNPRNYASGALGLKNFNEFKERHLAFFAYDIQPYRLYPSYEEVLNSLESLGFNTPKSSNTLQYPKDGIVYRLSSNKDYLTLGYTSHHPRGAFALKELKEGSITKLLDVEWKTGRSGVVSPVAILEPVDIEGAKVSRATLHNYDHIKSLGLEIGCMVEVIRSGEIIPKILRRV